MVEPSKTLQTISQLLRNIAISKGLSLSLSLSLSLCVCVSVCGVELFVLIAHGFAHGFATTRILDQNLLGDLGPCEHTGPTDVLTRSGGPSSLARSRRGSGFGKNVSGCKSANV